MKIHSKHGYDMTQTHSQIYHTVNFKKKKISTMWPVRLIKSMFVYLLIGFCTNSVAVTKCNLTDEKCGDG